MFITFCITKSPTTCIDLFWCNIFGLILLQYYYCLFPNKCEHIFYKNGETYFCLLDGAGLFISVLIPPTPIRSKNVRLLLPYIRLLQLQSICMKQFTIIDSDSSSLHF